MSDVLQIHVPREMQPVEHVVTLCFLSSRYFKDIFIVLDFISLVPHHKIFDSNHSRG